MIDLAVPEWLDNKIKTWANRLGLYEWEIAIRLAMAPNGDPDCQGLAEQFPDINFARITFRADVEDNTEWEIVVVHELLHVKHARVDHLVEGVMIARADDPTTCAIVYRQAIESHIHSMATCLVNMVE